MNGARPALTYAGGCALVVLAGLVLSLGVLCIRGAGDTDPWHYLMWRGVGFSVALMALGLWRHGPALIRQIGAMGRFAWVAAFVMVASQACFVLAIAATTVAEVFFLLSLAPLLAALIARPLLNERIGLLGGLAIAMALAGVALMSGLTSSGPVSSTSAWSGRAMAFAAAIAFALYSLAIRGARREDIDPALVMTGILTVVAAMGAVAWCGLPWTPSATAVALALIHGAVVLSVGLVLFSRGSNVVPAVTLVMLAQAETIAAPVWTYLFFSETTSIAVMAGGALILVGVVLQAMDGARNVEKSALSHRHQAEDAA